MVDKRFFPEDTWADPKQPTTANAFSIELEPGGETHWTNYDLGHRFVRKRLGKFYRANRLKPGDTPIQDWQLSVSPFNKQGRRHVGCGVSAAAIGR